MAQKPQPSKKPSSNRKAKQPTQRPAMQRVMIVGPSGKRRFEWRPW